MSSSRLRRIAGSGSSAPAPRDDPSRMIRPPSAQAATAVAIASGSPVASTTTSAEIDATDGSAASRKSLDPPGPCGLLAAARGGDHGCACAACRRKPLRERSDRAVADHAHILPGADASAQKAVAGDDRQIDKCGVQELHSGRNPVDVSRLDGCDRRVRHTRHRDPVTDLEARTTDADRDHGSRRRVAGPIRIGRPRVRQAKKMRPLGPRTDHAALDLHGHLTGAGEDQLERAKHGPARRRPHDLLAGYDTAAAASRTQAHLVSTPRRPEPPRLREQRNSRMRRTSRPAHGAPDA